MSDIEFLAIKEFDGKRVDVDNEIDLNSTTTETDVATQTASSGKDLYLASASVASRVVNAGGILSFRLYANGVEIEKIYYISPGLNDEFIINFKTIGVKVAATQIIKITAQYVATGSRIVLNGKLILFEEDTGETPQVASI